MDSVLTWLVRDLHVTSAALWVGGYAMMAFVIVPALAHNAHESLHRLALAATRVLTFAGVATILGGLVLIARSRGYASLLSGEWGSIVITCIVLAVVLMGIGDAGLRPALRRMHVGAEGGGKIAQRWAMAGLLVGVIALGFMTRALYARS